jgi:anti-sigma B factor antagonist
MNYWNRGEYIAAGTGAHSFLQGLRAKNTSDVYAYIERLQGGLSPEIETAEVTHDESIREFIFLGLRKREGIDLKDDKLRQTAIASAVGDLVDQGHKKIMLNLARVTHIDSSGIGELVRSLTAVRNQHGELKLVNISMPVNEVLKITHLHAVFDISENETSGVASFRGRP